jgi:hypothetical protein
MPNRYTHSVYKTQFIATVLQKAHIVGQEVSHWPSPQGSEFNAGQLYKGLVMDKVVFDEDFYTLFLFSLSVSFHQCCMFTY